MLAAGGVALADGLADLPVEVISLLAIPPVIAAASASVPKTGAVGISCLALAVLSSAWNEDQGSAQFAVSGVTVVAGALVALWIASLRAYLNRERRASELLAEAGALMEDALDQRQRAEHLARLAVPALGDAAMVDVLSTDGRIERQAATGDRPKIAKDLVALQGRPIDPLGHHPAAEVIRSGRSQLFDQLSDEQLEAITSEPEERELLRRHRFKSCLVLPLGARGSVLGALTLWIMRPANAFDETAKRTAKRLADRGALALDNARLHEQQAHIATVLQHSLLPRSLPEIRGFETASRFLAAGEAYEVGGDFYDVFRTGSATWHAVIGDVCGKGPEAAALTALARYTIRTASTPESPPSEVLRTLHESISADRSDLRFCTAALARIQAPANGRTNARLTISLGGHPLPLVLRKDGRVDRVGQPGSLLGALPSPILADVDARLAAGDSLVLYTDGIIESQDRTDGDGPNWLVTRLAETAGNGAEEIADRLAKAAIRRQGGEPRDDIAVLVLHRRGAG
jgi:serine phosphatase RsbU (regulator of sigma subunit)